MIFCIFRAHSTPATGSSNPGEKDYYLAALEAAGGNREKAARLLGLSPRACRKALRGRLGSQEEE